VGSSYTFNIRHKNHSGKMNQKSLDKGRFRTIYRCIIYFVLLLSVRMPASALSNNAGAHDPSSIVKCGNTYWIFATGGGIAALYSTDLISWNYSASPFPNNQWPSWINSYVPAFAGTFWAPECRYMNGKYYLYYACSSWGVKTSCIGLATNKSLDPGSDDYEWIDQGVVVFSDASSDANCIDPSLFEDKEGKLWLTYGSYFGGIRIIELDPTTGLSKNSTKYSVASGDCEASYVINHGDYYYLFINRGTCCQGVSSTYHIQVGRSESPTGPFLDKNNHNLNAGYGSTILGTSGSFIGPGCLGYYVENGIEWATFHYYNGDNAGAATLAVAGMRWDESDWPVITLAWLDDGVYSIASQFNYYVWESASCPGVETDAIAQGYYNFEPCQKWSLTSLGNGYYSIQAFQSDLVVEPDACESSTGTPLVLGPDSGESCQIWRFERSNWGSYSIASKLGNRVATLVAENNEEGTPIKIAGYMGTATQKWIVSDTSENITPVNSITESKEGMILYPNPVVGGNFSIKPDETNSNKALHIVILTLDGYTIYESTVQPGVKTSIKTSMPPGVYWVCVKGSSLRNKIVIL
jgi:arabinan endo-1,5-alpha-L-arabinosidase